MKEQEENMYFQTCMSVQTWPQHTPHKYKIKTRKQMNNRQTIQINIERQIQNSKTRGFDYYM